MHLFLGDHGLEVTGVHVDFILLGLVNIQLPDQFNDGTVSFGVVNGGSIETQHASSEPRLDPVSVDSVGVPCVWGSRDNSRQNGKGG